MMARNPFFNKIVFQSSRKKKNVNINIKFYLVYCILYCIAINYAVLRIISHPIQEEIIE